MATFIEYSSMHPAGDEDLRTRIGEHDEDPIANTQKPKITERVLSAGTLHCVHSTEVLLVGFFCCIVPRLPERTDKLTVRPIFH